jgi:hypothetical protein
LTICGKGIINNSKEKLPFLSTIQDPNLAERHQISNSHLLFPWRILFSFLRGKILLNGSSGVFGKEKGGERDPELGRVMAEAWEEKVGLAANPKTWRGRSE